MSFARVLPLPRAAFLAVAAAALTSSPIASASSHEHQSGSFAGVKADRGTVTHRVEAGQHVLALSDDFRIPDAPDAHWQIVDSRGTVFQLDRLIVKPEQTLKRKISVPPYVTDVAKVQMWCAYAEVLLGEASFATPVATSSPQMQVRTAKAGSGAR